MPISNSQFGMVRNTKTKVTVPSNPGGFGGAPKPNISMPTPRVTAIPTPRMTPTSTSTPRVTATPTPQVTSTPSIPNNPEFRGSYPPATKLNTPSTSRVSTPTPASTPTPMNTPMTVPTPMSTPTASPTPSSVKTPTIAMFGAGR